MDFYVIEKKKASAWCILENAPSTEYVDI